MREWEEPDRSHWAKPRDRQAQRTELINTTSIGMPVEPAPDAAELLQAIPVIASTTTLVTSSVRPEEAEQLRAAGRPVPKNIFAFLEKVDARLVAIIGSVTAGFSPVFVRMSGENTATSVLFRFGFALIPLLILALIERRLNGPMPRRTMLLHLLGGGFFGLDVGLWTQGVLLAGAGIATVAGNLQVIIVPLIALVIFRERLSIAFIASIPVMLTGVLLLSGIIESGDLSGDVFIGVLLAVTGGFAYSVYILILGRARATGHASTQVFLALLSTTIVGTAISSSFGAPNLTPPMGALLLLLITALLGQVVGWIATSNALARLDSATGSMLLLTQPMIAIVAGMVLLNEQISLLQWIGVVAIIVTVAFISLSNNSGERRRRRRVKRIQAIVHKQQRAQADALAKRKGRSQPPQELIERATLAMRRADEPIEGEPEQQTGKVSAEPADAPSDTPETDAQKTSD